MQQQGAILPIFLQTDKALEKLEPNESPFIKALGWDINTNPNQGIGTGTPIGDGQNLLKLTPTKSNEAIPSVLLPEGFNKNIGSFESETTQECYVFNFNGDGHHGIYVIDGNTLQWQKVIEDIELGFTDDPENFIANHRVTLRATFDKDKNIIEKYLILTDGNGWQKYISVIAAIKTNGFDASLYPYWSLRPPHFDRRELLEFAPRPPMYKPIVAPIDNSPADINLVNRIIDKSIQFAYDFLYTDGRPTTFSPWSLPLIVKSQDFLNNPDSLPKKAKLTLYAGSCLVEKVRIYIKLCGGIWGLYDTLEKYTTCENNSPEVIGNDYWLRTNPWSENNYDTNLNTIEYIFDYSKITQIIDQQDANRLQNDMPLRSVSQMDLGDSVAYGYNQYGYPNFNCDVLDNINIEVKEKQNTNCNIPARKIRLYAYIGMCHDNFNYCSQIGYYVGTDTQIRFGGLNQGTGNTASLNVDESKAFDLNFADKSAPRVYLKGTPYYADGVWYQVNADNSLAKLNDAPYDLSKVENLTAVQNIFNSGSYFICVFDLTVPAGRYIATLGRHNVASTGDYRGTSTYCIGIANSRITKTTGNNLRAIDAQDNNCIVSFSKEMEIDCTASDVDVWGNNADTFYIYCPYITGQGNGKFRFIEGYLYEELNNPIPVELFPYQMNHNATDNSGVFTDKNGFYFAYTKVANADDVDIQFAAKINCAFPTFFLITTNQAGSGWRPNAPAYLNNYNNGVVGDCNRIIYTGKITNLNGTINYSGISISIKDGTTVVTRQDGTFEMVLHNGQSTARISNVYVNASGNYLITVADCGYMPLNSFNENLIPCVNCTERVYPLPLILGINIQTIGDTSLKEGGVYSITCYGADLAGRVMFANIIEQKSVPSFLERNNVNATYFQAIVNNAFNLSAYPDIKWFTFSVSKNTRIKKYVQWVGDNIKYIDTNGNVVNDPNSAVFCAITIDSLYNYNVQKNFSVLAKYQFVEGDRLVILDNGDGQLLDTVTYGQIIDLQILGTNYNQAAINAGLLPPLTNTVLTTQEIALSQSIALYVRYNSRLDVLKDKTGFWIEIYTPTQESDKIPYCEIGFYPVINNRIAEFIGFVNGQPTYDFLSSINIDYWDTYLISRNITIPKVGDKFFAHPFESPNISDDFGEGCTSCGRQNVVNEEAIQRWYKDDVIKGDDFVGDGLINGLSTFRAENRKNFKGYNWGGIIAMIQQRSIIAFICENDWFCTNYNFQYLFANAQGVQVANLDNKLSEPIQKIGSNYGLALEHTRDLIVTDRFVFWYDYKNSAVVKFDYQGAVDISRLGIQSYINAKTKFITNYNNTVPKEKRFEVMMGIDRERNNIYLTFRPRWNNSNNALSYVNNRRNWDLKQQETVVYNIDAERWVRTEIFTPEGYGNIKGKETGVEMLSFAAGKPYRHFGGNGNSFLNFYGITGEPVVAAVFNAQSDIVKILQSISLDSTMKWFADLIYSNFINSYSYIPLNYVKDKENVFYAPVLKNMNSYPPIDSTQLFRSMLLDGMATRGLFFVCRLVGNPKEPTTYRELKNVFWLLVQSGNVKK